MRALLFSSLLFAFALHATKHESCETTLAGTPPVPLTLTNEDALFFDVDATPLDGDSLRRLGDALGGYTYLGPRPVARLRLRLFDVGVHESVDVVTPVTSVRLGAHLERDQKEVKVRVELPFAHLGRRPAVARAITDLFNHFDLLRQPHVLTREMTLLRCELARLIGPNLTPAIRPSVITSAIKLLDDALALRTPLAGRSAHLGKRYAAYFRARQMLVYAWREVEGPAARRRAHELLGRYRPRAPYGPTTAVLGADDVVNQAVDAAGRTEGPWFFTPDVTRYRAISLWFELLANRDPGAAADGGLFLSQRMPVEWSETELARLDHPTSGGVVGDDDKTASSLRNTADEPTPSIVDPAQPAPGLPDAGGGGDVGIGGVDPTDAAPGGPGSGI